MRKLFSAISIFVLLILCLFIISCDEKIEEPKTPEQVVYKTPTMKGVINLPKNTGLLAEDFWVKVTDGNDTKSITKVKPDGSFVVSGLEEEVKYSVLITSVTPEHTNYSKGLTDEEEGYGGWLTSVSASIEGTDVGSVKVKPLGTIKGVAKLQNQEEFYDITVYIPGTSFIAMTDKDGNYSISNVPEGTYQLRYILSGYTSIMSESFVFTSGGDESKHPVLIRPEVTLLSNVATVEGYAFRDGVADNSGINIKLEKEDKTASYASLTSENGFFQILGVQPGNYRVLASYSGYPTQTSDLFKVEEGSTTVLGEQISLFENIGTISGSVSLDNSEIKGGITILFTNTLSSESFSTVSDEEGHFQKNLKPGSYKLTAGYAGYTSQVLNVDVIQGSNINVVVPSLINANGGFSGKVVLLGNINDSSGVVVSYVHSNDPSIKGTTVTDVDGSYLVTNLSKSGQYYLSFTKDGFLKDQSHVVFVSKGVVNEVEEVELRNLTSIVKGIIQLEGTTDFTGISVLLKAQTGEMQFSSSTDDKGEYIINNVIPGKYNLYVSKDGYQTKVVENIVVETATKKTLDNIMLSIGIRSIIGKVNLELKMDHSGALITATNTKEPTLIYSAITNSSGNFALAGMKPGEYNIVVSNTGYRTMTLPTIDVIANTTESIDTVNLEIAKGYITGYVKLEGRIEFDGIKVDLVGTDYSTYTNEEGVYNFYVPSGNYPGGVSFSKEDFEIDADTNTITVLTDSTYAVTEKYTLKASAIPVVKGQIDVRGTDDDSDVSVKIKGTNYVFTTEKNGYFEFVHIPSKQDYVLVVERENATSVELVFSTLPSKEIDLGIIMLTPQSSSIEGTITTFGQKSYEGIKVEVETEGEKVLDAVTDSSGYFYIGGILSQTKNTITISKKGWDSVTRIIDDLEPLEVRDITKNDPINLVDTTAPVINSVMINSGSTVSSNALVSIEVNATDDGSGIEFMRTTWLDDFEGSSWMSYTKIFDSVIPIATNEKKIIKVQVKDASGNVSEVCSDDIALVGQVNTVFGALSQESELHWMNIDNTPYVVTGDIIINPGYCLVIDPGVQVYFAGDYGISVRGTIYAVGTEEEPIRFEPIKDNIEGQNYFGSWKGITLVDSENKYDVLNNKYKFTYLDGCTLQYCYLIDIWEGLCGRGFVSNCEIIEKEKYNYTSWGSSERVSYSLKDFSGILTKSRLKGNVDLHSNKQDKLFFDNVFSGIKQDNQFNIDHSTVLLENNIIRDYELIKLSWIEQSSKINNNSFIDINVINLCTRVPEFRFNNFEGKTTVVTESYDYYEDFDLCFSNFDCESSPIVNISEDYNSMIKWENNFWGHTNTLELQNIDNGTGKTPSFIMDGRVPGNIDKAIVVYQPYSIVPWSFAGYRGDDYASISASLLTSEEWVNEAIFGKPVSFTITEEVGDISEFRIAQTVQELLDLGWSSFIGVGTINLLDTQYVSADGFAEVYIQGRTRDGLETGIEKVVFSYDRPKILNCSIINNHVYTNYADLNISIKAYDSYFGTLWCDLFVDDQQLLENAYLTSDQIARLPYSSFSNGQHTIKIIIRDSVGNESEPYFVCFSVDRVLPTISELSVFDGINIGLNESLPVSFTINNASHVKQVLFKIGNQISYKMNYNDNTEDIKTLETVIESMYIPSGQNGFVVEVLDYAGNVVSSEPVTINVSGNAIAPAISLIGLDEGLEYVEDSTYSIIVNAFDEGGVKDIWVMFGEEVINTFQLKEFSQSSVERSEIVSLPLGYRKNGEYLITIFAEDFAGNVSTLQRNISINRSLPIIRYFKVEERDGVLFYEWSISYSYSYDTFLLLNGVEKSIDWQINKDTLPMGENTLQVVAEDTVGNRVYSEIKTVTVSRDIYDSSFGLDKSWNSNGNLLADSYTDYLWTFDNLNPAIEEVDSSIIGSISEINECIGKASNLYVNQDIDFTSSQFTVEFWAKGRVHIALNKVFDIQNIYSEIMSVGYYYQTASEEKNSYLYFQRLGLIDEWAYWVIVSTGNEIKVYRNGVLIANSITQLVRESDRLTIECGRTGCFDEIRISSKARSIDEIWQYYKYSKDKIQNQ